MPSSIVIGTSHSVRTPASSHGERASGSRETGGPEYRAGHDAVSDRVRVLVRTAGRRRAFPGPLADPGHVPRHGAEAGDSDGVTEVGRTERAEYVGDLHVGLAIGPIEQG